MNSEVIVSSDSIVCLVGGATIGNICLSADFPFVDVFLGVDAGADHLLSAGVQPVAVIGDLDSISDVARATFAGLLCHISEQETTDFEKALTRVAASVVLAVGFTGGRIDHMLSVLNVMTRFPAQPVILVDDEDVSFLAGPRPIELVLPAGARVSLMPLAQVKVTATGVRWPLSQTALHLIGKTSASNEAVGGPVHIAADGPLLITLPRAHLQTALKAVVRAK